MSTPKPGADAPATKPQAPLPQAEDTSHNTNSSNDDDDDARASPSSPENCPHDSLARGLNRYTCPECHARLEANIDDVLRQVMIREGWTEEELEQVGSMQRFAGTPVKEIRPTEGASVEERRAQFAREVMREQDSRRDRARRWRAERAEGG
ncbi:uncharacterized protein HMPREF1541_07548 [Cyphellophora europaea CBS 101466]|uniref:Uncharacterized protein n=1 Tax=Cyphellophora europaea (strain CBS 101466) TaxID=1220924 RepID=W2RNN8_CYPE1|nr:uncharacterized protein HMPREF1541_07548 [Cyphellophora europaea CBS 101466]ETN37925.1 hypothetical protein HMPREF1541_07548 [Cyphellophora europaea CBS 101466]